MGHEDAYPSHAFTLEVDGYACMVENETLYYALLSLKERQREVLLLGFWHGLTDGEIAEKMEVSVRTVYNLRQRAFRAVTIMEKNQQTMQLTVGLIRRAVSGEREAQDELLRIYEPFHDSLLVYAEAGLDGCIHHETREDWKSMVQMRMLQAIQTRWRSLL